MTDSDDREHHGRVAGDGLLHPAVLASMALLVCNDHVLKVAWPGPITGKLSDFAGLAFFPILLAGGWELALDAIGRLGRPSPRALVVAVALTGVVFTLVKTAPVAGEAWGWALGMAQWLLALPFRLLDSAVLPPVVAARLVVDPTDLVALPALAIPLFAFRHRAARATGGSMARAIAQGMPR